VNGKLAHLNSKQSAAVEEREAKEGRAGAGSNMT